MKTRKARGTRSLHFDVQRSAKWRRIAGPPTQVCRSCGGTLEVGGLVCPCCRGASE